MTETWKINPKTISRGDILREGSDEHFRETIYMMVQSTGRLLTCREAFARTLSLTPSQFAVLMGVAYRQEETGVTIRVLADHISLAATHVTTEVGRLVRKGLLEKKTNASDRRSVLIMLTDLGHGEIDRIEPFVRSVNDLLFQNIPAHHLEIARDVAHTIVVNSELAMVEIKRRESASTKWE